jgi:3-oxoadipate enol-lactonase
MPRANINGIDINYSVSGHGEPLVLIQGLGSPGSAWFFQLRAFSRFYKVIILDNRGAGRSSKPGGQYSVKTMADDVIGLMDHLGIDKAHILGASMGGMIAQEIAISYPQRVKKLVLACTTAGVDDADMRLMMQSSIGLGDGASEADMGSLDARVMGKVMGTVTALSFNRRMYRMFFIPAAKLYFRYGGIAAGVLCQLRSVASHSTMDRLGQIKAPTLVIAGTDDKIIPPQSSDILSKNIPGAKLVRVEGGSHSFFMEMHGRFNREVLEFLKG